MKCSRSLAVGKALLTFACLGAVATAGAAEWSAAPTVSWSMDHDSNRLLIEDGPASEAGFLQLDLLLKRAMPDSSFTLRPHVGWQRFTDNSVRNADYQSLDAAGMWKEDNSVYTAQAAYTRDNLLNSELADTGIFTGGSKRTSKNGAFSWTHDFSDRNNLQAQLSYADVQYEDQDIILFFGLPFEVRNLYGYRYPSITIVQSHVISPRTTLQVSAYGGRLTPTEDRPVSDNYGTQIGFTRALTSRYTLSISAGGSRQSTDSNTETGYIGRLELTRTDALGQWHASIARSVSASALGLLVRIDEAILSLDQRLTPRWSTHFALRGVRTEDVGLVGETQHSLYERADAAFIWQTTRTWKLTATTSFTRARRADALPVASGWTAMLAAVWTPRPSMLSR